MENELRPGEHHQHTVAAAGDDGQAEPWLIDVLLATSVTLAIALIIAVDQRAEGSPDATAYVFAAGFGGLMLLRRARPRIVLVVTVVGLFAYYAMEYPPIGVAVPVVAALYSAAEAGLMGWSAGAGFIVFVVSTYFRLQEGTPVAYELVSNIALMAAAIALGDGIRTRRARKIEQEEIHRLTTLEFTREADRRIQDERENIARDLHDLVGHTMSVISLQANVAAEAIPRGTTTASEAIEQIQDASKQTMRELRATVRVLRSPLGEDAERGVVSLAGVDGLLVTLRAVGIEVTSQIDVSADGLSSAIDAAAYRIIQEALTNVIRHAGATHTHVHAGLLDESLRLVITDNGRGCIDTGHTGGNGLNGMAERARLLGGTLATHSQEGGGFTVEAELPAKLTS